MSEQIRTVALSARAANSCEYAIGRDCECRCAGALHGAARGKLSELPVDDPHSPSSACKWCKGAGKRPGYNRELRDWDENAQCGYCEGKGRILKPAVLRELKKIEEAPEWVTRAA